MSEQAYAAEMGYPTGGHLNIPQSEQDVKDSVLTSIHELRAEVEVAHKEFSNLTDKIMPFLVMEDTPERSMSEPGADSKVRPASDVKRQIQDISHSVNELTRRMRIVNRQVDN